MRGLTVAAWCVMVAGCAQEVEPLLVEQEYVTVIDMEGGQKVIPLDDFIDRQTGTPSAERILAIDRSTQQRAWVDAKEIGSEPPATARYIPLVRSEP